MGTRLDPGKFDCASAALDDEPQFTLLARDPTMPKLVTSWAMQRLADINMGLKPSDDISMVLEAFNCAAAAEEWRKKNLNKWRIPRTK